jgi:C4-dicarboxylate transporter
VFGPVVIIAGFFWLGGDSLKDILKDKNAQGLMFDWGFYIAAHVPINTFMVSIMVTVAGILAAFDGSGYAAIPLGTSIAMALGKPIGANVAILASQAQMAAIWTGATLVPWGFLAVTASFAGVDPADLARRNMWPTLLGLGAGVIVTALLA